MFFDSWETIARAVIIGVLVYVTIILLLRITGKRTLSKWNAFDFILTVALGSTLAAVVLQPDTTLAEGVAVLGLFVFLQFIVTWTSVRSPFIRDLVKSEPSLLFYQGEFVSETMKKERVAESEVRAALREKGIGSLDDVEAVVLETDGSFSAVKQPSAGPRSTLWDVTGFRERAK